MTDSYDDDDDYSVCVDHGPPIRRGRGKNGFFKVYFSYQTWGFIAVPKVVSHFFCLEAIKKAKKSKTNIFLKFSSGLLENVPPKFRKSGG